MTRENKLALVLGFGLLLLAGILVSDYLSAGNRVNEDPLIATSTSAIPDSKILKPQGLALSDGIGQIPYTDSIFINNGKIQRKVCRISKPLSCFCDPW